MDKESIRYKAIKSAKRKNKKFEQASKANKRVMIAKDVIAQLKVANLKAETGNTYFEIQEYVPQKDISNLILKDEGYQCELRDALPALETCTVCALGGIFYSLVAIDDRFKLDSYTNSDDEVYVEISSNEIFDRVKKVFTPYQMGLIESAFEAKNSMHIQELDTDEFSDRKDRELRRARDFGDILDEYGDYTDSMEADELLVKIMNNIIENKGTFKP